MSKVERAVSCFKEGFNCTQAMLSTYGPELGLDRENALKVSVAFGAGVGRLAETCGAVNGAIMVIGLKHGSFKSEDIQAKEKTYDLAREFVKRFKSLNGSITCKDLLNCDLSTPEGFQFAKENKLIPTVCPKIVQNAAEIIEQLL